MCLDHLSSEDTQRAVLSTVPFLDYGGRKLPRRCRKRRSKGRSKRNEKLSVRCPLRVVLPERPRGGCEEGVVVAVRHPRLTFAAGEHDSFVLLQVYLRFFSLLNGFPPVRDSFALKKHNVDRQELGARWCRREGARGNGQTPGGEKNSNFMLVFVSLDSLKKCLRVAVFLFWKQNWPDDEELFENSKNEVAKSPLRSWRFALLRGNVRCCGKCSKSKPCFGQMLINWFVSAFGEDHYLRHILTNQDLRILGAQFCTHMLAAGVIRQIPDKDVPLEVVFRPDLMYYWAHSEAPILAPPTPGKLSSGAWPPSLPDVSAIISRPGAKYTEAEVNGGAVSPRSVSSPTSAPPTPGIAETETKMTEDEEEEFQQVVMGLKRGHQKNIGRLEKEQEIALFNLRGEEAVKLLEYEEKIHILEQENSKLLQEVERYQTLASIEALTAKAKADFESPSEEKPPSEIKEEEKEKENVSEGGVKVDESTKEPGQTEDNAGTKEENLKSTSPAEDKKPVVEVETLPTKKTDEILPEAMPVTKSPSAMPPPPPPPMPEMGPPPPPMPGMGPPPPPMPGMGPPPPPMPGMGPPPPPMPGMGPPPPPMPGMGPPPPPMPGMGPPPPPMPGMGPPPPPMPGMGPPPPPMPGMGPPPPPPMSGAPPPPLLPGMPPPPPPPGGTGAPLPFPTPPPGGWNANRAMLRKQPVNPKVPMRPLYWTRILVINPVIQPDSEAEPTSPLWEKLEEEDIDNLDEFTNLFARHVPDKKPAKKKAEQPSKLQAVKILDSKRSQNVGILASCLHVDFSEIESAIYNFDTSVVSLEALQQIYEARPSEEELSAIRSHVESKPDIPLDKPEQFLYELAEIPNFADRIACFMFQSEFEENVSLVSSKLNNIKTTCETLSSSKSLQTVLAIILTLGNYMNGGNRARGQADGFGLEILPKLRDVKSKDNSMTLLHFIVRTYMQKCKDPLEAQLPVPEPGDIDRASAVNFDELETSLKTLKKETDVCEKKTEKVIAASSEDNLQPFKSKMESFLETAKKQLNDEMDNLQECRNKFAVVTKFYQYVQKGAKEEEVKDFFSVWAPFCHSFKDIWKKEQQRIIKQKADQLKRRQEKLQDVEKKGTAERGLKAKLRKKVQKTEDRSPSITS